MTLLVGHPPDVSGTAELELAAMLSRTADEDIVVATVTPAPWFPGMGRMDSGYQDELTEIATEALAEAQREMPTDVNATYEHHTARSIPRGLLELTAQHDASMIVVGSSAGGPFGHVTLGSATDRLLHSSPVPVALATRGFRRPGERVSRVMIGYDGSPESDELVAAAGSLAVRLGVAVQLVSFAIRRRAPVVSSVGQTSEDAITAEWVTETVARAHKALEGVAGAERLAKPTGIEIGRGRTWCEAVDDVAWRNGDVLVIGSSSLGLASRVFLGSRAAKILRHSPAPVIVVPRSME